MEQDKAINIIKRVLEAQTPVSLKELLPEVQSYSEFIFKAAGISISWERLINDIILVCDTPSISISIVRSTAQGVLDALRRCQDEEERSLKEFKSKTYALYLRSEAWQARRDAALKYYFKRCCICGSNNNLQIHHINYNNIFNETNEDLTVLCSGCHKFISLREKRRAKKK